MNIEPIAIIHTPFKEKFGIPRQPGLVAEAKGRIQMLEPFKRKEAFSGLEDFSHIWLIWQFHALPEGEWKASVRPPRLGGNQKVGVFASRSPFRPNALGLSVVKLDLIEGTEIHVSGVDLLDQTPLFDIKPYIPYSDSVTDARGGFAQNSPQSGNQVEFSEVALEQLGLHEKSFELQSLIMGCARVDPRPAYKHACDGSFAFRLMDVDVACTIVGNSVRIEGITYV